MRVRPRRQQSDVPPVLPALRDIFGVIFYIMSVCVYETLSRVDLPEFPAALPQPAEFSLADDECVFRLFQASPPECEGFEVYAVHPVQRPFGLVVPRLDHPSPHQEIRDSVLFADPFPDHFI